MAAKDNLIDRLVKVRITRDQSSSPGSSTLAQDASATDTTIEVADDSNFADGQPIRIGSGDTMEFNWVDGSPASDIITLGRPLVNSHASGTVVVEQVSYDMGPPLAEGATWNLQGTSVDIPVATQRFPFASLPGFNTLSLAWPLPSFTPALFAFATGMSLSRVTGSGTAATPTVVSTDGSAFGEVANQVYIAEAVTVAGNPIAVEFWGASTDLQNFSLAFSRGQQTPLPFACVAPQALFETAGYTTMDDDASYAAASGKVWSALSAFGVFVDSGTTTALNGALSAGASTLVMNSGASFSDGDWIKISGALGVEYTQLKNKSTNNFGLTIPVLRAIGNGVTITKVTQAPFAAVAPAGVTLSVSTTTQDVNSAIHPAAIHRRIGSTTISVSGGLIDITLANIARAMGVPSADIISSTRFLAGQNIGTEGVDGVYFTGTTTDGSTTMVIAAGTQVDLASVASTWTNQGEAAQVPFTVKPTSCLTLLQYT